MSGCTGELFLSLFFFETGQLILTPFLLVMGLPLIPSLLISSFTLIPFLIQLMVTADSWFFKLF